MCHLWHGGQFTGGWCRLQSRLLFHQSVDQCFGLGFGEVGGTVTLASRHCLDQLTTLGFPPVAVYGDSNGVQHLQLLLGDQVVFGWLCPVAVAVERIVNRFCH